MTDISSQINDLNRMDPAPGLSMMADLTMTGYLHAGYPAALAGFGKPVFLQGSSGWLLERNIPGTGGRDAMGCYPLFLCQDWTALGSDLDQHRQDWISVALVADPFGEYDEKLLTAAFPDALIPFKEHYVIDLHKNPRSYVSDHHARNARQALQRVKVEVQLRPVDLLEDWVRLYEKLIRRHSITGIPAFSKASFASQLQVPGLVAVQASTEEEIVGILLFFTTAGRAYYHLGAFSETGYKRKASFALFSTAIGIFADAGLGWLDLGAGAGTHASGSDGLTRFKAGWSNCQRTAWFCGRILNQAAYAETCALAGKPPAAYFPHYRSGEFNHG